MRYGDISCIEATRTIATYLGDVVHGLAGVVAHAAVLIDEHLEHRRRQMRDDLVDVGAETDRDAGERDQTALAMIAVGRRAEGVDHVVGELLDLVELVLVVHVLDHALDLEGAELALVVELVAEIARNVWCELHRRH